MSIAIITGNMGVMGELNQTRTGQHVINFSVVETKRRFNKSSNQWEDGDEIWYNLTAWGRLAENLAQVGDDGKPLIRGGTHLIIQARYDLKQGFTTKDGQEVGPQPQLVAEDIGVSMKVFPATSPFLKSKQGGQGGGQSRQASASASKPATKQASTQTSGDEFDSLFEDDDFEDDFFG